jgi:hypothetical protein
MRMSRFTQRDGRNLRRFIVYTCVIAIPKDAMGDFVTLCLRRNREHG